MLFASNLTSPPASIQRKQVFTASECEDILRIVNQPTRLSIGLVGTGNNDYVFRPELRIVKTSELLQSEAPWLYEKCKLLVQELNEEFKFELTHLDCITFMRYDEPAGDVGAGHFTWHSDCGYGESAMRKISISIALNDSSDYDGGDFCIFHRGPMTLPRTNAGDIIAIPSYVNHRVTPVTRGTRYVLVLFVLGPRIR